VVRRRAPLVGARLAEEAPRGFVSPVEARVHVGIAYGDLLAEEQAYLARPRSLGQDVKVAARALVATALGQGAGREEARPFLVSTNVDNVSLEEALSSILASPPEGRASLVHFVHPHALNTAFTDGALREQLARADLVLPDGIGLRLAARVLGVSLRHNLNGTDLLPVLCARAAQEGIPLVLVGAAEGIAEACRERLLAATPGLRIPIAHHGYLDHDTSRALAGRIGALGRVIVLVGMGTPLQERWAHAHLADLPECTALTVGGLFDFFSGRMPRAPLALRELGLEWAFRLAQEPRRLGKRYLLGNPLFLTLATMQRTGVGHRPTRAPHVDSTPSGEPRTAPRVSSVRPPRSARSPTDRRAWPWARTG
jgi:N-acetylglucosaminyldiphosphoundecaprenol N-acetyl-beta-D-mannosaminyltransferase